MELVYLWVEEYKNIKKQGFNFSPRFTCKFHDEYEKDKDGKERLKENCVLEIKENSDYVNIFPKNINVTAIVGENGSGKSGILDSLTYAIYERKNSFLICLINNTYFVYCGGGINFNNIKTNFEYTLMGKEKSNLIEVIFFETQQRCPAISYDYMYLFNGSFQDELYDEAYYHLEYEDNQIVPNNQIVSKELMQILQENPTSADSFLDLNIIGFHLTHNYHFINNCKYGLSLGLYSLESEKFIESLFIKDNFYDIYITALLVEILDSRNIFEYVSLEKKKYKINYRLIYELFKKKNFTEYVKYNEFQKLDAYIDAKDGFMGLNDLPKINNKFLKLFHFSFVSKDNRSFEQLSSGERIFLAQEVKIHHKISRMQSQNILFALDEIEISLHPQWQKKYIFQLINFLKKHDKNIHIACATHSPFILSDLPKENVIFLKNGKQVYPDIQTFGANIHTLLSHGFFMEDGLMGEFAKGKIDEVIHFLNGKESPIKDTDEAQKYISIIGEPILQRQLQKMLDSKKLDKIQEIDVLKTQIETLKNRLDILANNA